MFRKVLECAVEADEKAWGLRECQWLTFPYSRRATKPVVKFPKDKGL